MKKVLSPRPLQAIVMRQGLPVFHFNDITRDEHYE